MAIEERVIPYAPRSVFLPYHNRKERWAVLVAHRRAGKTVACVNDTIKKAVELSKPHGRYAYVAPFLAQAKEVAWDYLKRYAEPILADKNESELWVELVNGSRIRIHGADNPDRLRGSYLDGVVLDEYADMRPSVWGEVIRPMLADREGWATFIGTPKGKNEFYDIYDGATLGWPQEDGSRLKDANWFAVMLRASDTGLVSKAELASARETMTPDQYAQEFECSFDAAITGAYYAAELARAHEEGRVRRVPVDRYVPVQTAWDLGYEDATAIWFIQVVGQELHLIDYYEAHHKGFDHYADVLAEKMAAWGSGVRWGEHYFPHDLQAHMIGMDRSRVETLRSLGIDPMPVPVHAINDGINAVRRIFDRMWIDEERCRIGLEALKQYRRDFDEKTKSFKPKPRHDWTSHGADALRTFAAGWPGSKIEPKALDRHRRRLYGNDKPSGWMVA